MGVMPVHEVDTPVDGSLIILGSLSPPLRGKEVAADVDIDGLEWTSTPLDIGCIGVLITHSLQFKGLEAVSTKFIKDNLRYDKY